MFRRLLRLAWKVVKVTTISVVLVIGLALGSLWLEHLSSLDLPRPSGPHAVGRLELAWTDPGRPDPFAPAPAPRELLAWIWYPADPSDGAEPAQYRPASWKAALDAHSDAFLSTFLWRDPSGIHGHSLEAPALSTAQATWPVVIFRSGIGSLALDYSTLAEDLASHGYVVVGADTPYSTRVVVMPDGRVILATDEGNPGDAPMAESERTRRLDALVDVWSADSSFLLDQLARLDASDPSGWFTGRLDLAHVGIVGHSFGGATAAQACHDDPRFGAGVDLDGAPYGSVLGAGLAQPFLFLLSDHGDEWDAPGCDICDDIRAIARSAPANKLVVSLAGAHHWSFADAALVQSRLLRSVLSALGGPGGLQPRAGLAATSRYVREWLDQSLWGHPHGDIVAGPLVPEARILSW